MKKISRKRKKLVEWVIIDTFDASGAKYDFPIGIREVQDIAKHIGLVDFKSEVKGPVIILNVVK